MATLRHFRESGAQAPPRCGNRTSPAKLRGPWTQLGHLLAALLQSQSNDDKRILMAGLWSDEACKADAHILDILRALKGAEDGKKPPEQVDLLAHSPRSGART